MKNYQNFIMVNDSVVICFADGVIPIDASNPYCEKIKELLLQKKIDEAVDMIDVSGKLERHTSGRFYLQSGVIVLDGETLPVALSNRVLQFVDANLPYEPLIKFWENLKKNPSEESRKDLYGFLEHNGIPLTSDGCFIAYKRITEDWKDVQTKTFDNKPGTVVKMDREKVDADRNVTCSSGLHVAAYNYANGFYPNGILVEVKVNPMNVVAVPTDYNNEKMRVCEYEVIKQCGEERKEALYDYVEENVEENGDEDSDVELDNDYEDDYEADGEIELALGEVEDDGEDESDVCVECGNEFPADTEVVDGLCQSCEEKLSNTEATVEQDSRGRICVPSAIITAGMGLTTGQQVFAWAESNVVNVTSIKEKVPVSVSEYSVYTVDKSCNIRISKSLLEAAGIYGFNEFFLMYGEDGVLTIEAA